MVGERSRRASRVTRQFASRGAVALLSVVVASCASGSSPRAAENAITSTEPTVPDKPTSRFEDFHVDNFDHTSITINNRFFPLIPGMQYTYEGSTVEDGETEPHRVVFNVTDLVKTIGGVRTVVIWERDFKGDDLEEDELTFFAQDKSGNVWHLGQYSELWEGPEFSAGRAWWVGHPHGARAGIMMKADPQLGTPSWSEGYAPPPYFWTDRARVYRADQKTKVRAGSYDGIVVTEEFNAQEHGAFQLKYYAPGVGVVRVGWRGNDTSTESLELVKAQQLDSARIAKVRAGALELETRASLYGTAPPAQVRAAIPVA